MKKTLLIGILSVIMGFVVHACGSSSNSGSNGTSTALEYATYGTALNAVVPTGLKAGGANASVNVLNNISVKDLSGTCAADYTDCPYLTVEGGGDSSTGEILMRLWGLDYNSECTDGLIADGTCFHCADCGETAGGNFIKPTMFSAPTTCGTISTSAGHYVNMNVDPCFFDSMIAEISNTETCKTVVGGDVDISSVIPWYASWEIPQTIKFSSYYSRSGGLWWTINNGASGADQYFLSLDPNWLYAGIKNSEDNKFLFLGTGSPAYYSSIGEDSGINISAYEGPLDAITSTFEVIQIRDQGTNKYIERLRSNGTYLWYQKYYGSSYPSTPDEVDAVKDSPTDNRCVEIGSTKIVESKYVPLQSCVDSFGAASVAELNQDSNYTLKIIDAETAGSINFSTSLTPTVTTTSCLEEEPE